MSVYALQPTRAFSFNLMYKDCPKAQGEHKRRSWLLAEQSSAEWEVSRAHIWSTRSHWSKLGNPFGRPAQLQFLTTFSWQELPLLRRGTGVFFCIQIKRETFQTRASALPQRQERVKWARKRYTSQRSFNRTMTCCKAMSVKQTFLSAVTVLTVHALIASS